MNIVVYKRLENDFKVAKIELISTFKKLVEEEFGVQFIGAISGDTFMLIESGNNYPSATYDINDIESFKNDYLNIKQVVRFANIIKEMEEL